ncbi:MAG: hypothetical protein V3V22_10400, partial [Methylococcales bacterium]
MVSKKDLKSHIILGSTGKATKYTHPGSGGGEKIQVPAQNRQQHGAQLKSQIQVINQYQQEVSVASEDYELDSGLGIQVAFESFPDVELAIESLADVRQGVELLNVRHTTNQIFATIYVPAGKLTFIEK